jgi:hypothetical protein
MQRESNGCVNMEGGEGRKAAAFVAVAAGDGAPAPAHSNTGVATSAPAGGDDREDEEVVEVADVAGHESRGNGSDTMRLLPCSSGTPSRTPSTTAGELCTNVSPTEAGGRDSISAASAEEDDEVVDAECQPAWLSTQLLPRATMSGSADE